MSRLKVLFFCGERSPWGYAHLQPLLSESRFEVVGVVVGTDARWRTFRSALSGENQTTTNWLARSKRLLARLLGRNKPGNTRRAVELLSRHKVPVIWCDNANAAEALEQFKEFQADLLFSAAYPQIFGARLLSAFPRGAFNSHPSLLPRCQGAHPVFWAIASGESKSGSTIHIMIPKVDQGDIVAQVEVDLGPRDTRSQLYDKLIAIIPDLVTQFADFLSIEGSKARPQDQSQITCYRNDRQIHRRIFWTEMDAMQIHNLVRACDGAAYFWQNNGRIFVREVEPSVTNQNMTNNVCVPAGTVVEIDNGSPIVAAKNGFVKLTQLKYPRFRGFRFAVGQVLS